MNEFRPRHWDPSNPESAPMTPWSPDWSRLTAAQKAEQMADNFEYIDPINEVGIASLEAREAAQAAHQAEVEGRKTLAAMNDAVGAAKSKAKAYKKVLAEKHKADPLGWAAMMKEK